MLLLCLFGTQRPGSCQPPSPPARQGEEGKLGPDPAPASPPAPPPGDEPGGRRPPRPAPARPGGRGPAAPRGAWGGAPAQGGGQARSPPGSGLCLRPCGAARPQRAGGPGKNNKERFWPPRTAAPGRAGFPPRVGVAASPAGAGPLQNRPRARSKRPRAGNRPAPAPPRRFTGRRSPAAARPSSPRCPRSGSPAASGANGAEGAADIPGAIPARAPPRSPSVGTPGTGTVPGRWGGGTPAPPPSCPRPGPRSPLRHRALGKRSTTNSAETFGFYWKGKVCLTWNQARPFFPSLKNQTALGRAEERHFK